MAEVHVPSAAPVPRGPSVLLLGSAAGLLDRPGCPACRYAAEASDAYLAWFALDGHHDADVLGRVCGSRGMCAPHTRRLLSQPGAASRLTAVYRYIIEAAMRDLSARPARCPACEHDAAAADRVLGILLEDVMAGDRTAYKQHGGLCLPHLRRAATIGKSADLRWPVRFMVSRIAEQPPSLDLLAGSPDADADSRASLRAALPLLPPRDASPACRPCWAAADAERQELAGIAAADGRAAASGPDDRLCAPHLRDAALAAGCAVRDVLAPQAQRHSARLAQVLDSRPRLLGISVGYLSPRSRRALADPGCPVCRRGDSASSQEVERLRAMLRAWEAGRQTVVRLCVRHGATLHAMDPRAGRVAASSLAEFADQLVTELTDDFIMQTWAHRADARGADMTAWRRAATFLDGGVLGGCPA
jgi:hypothetical protein